MTSSLASDRARTWAFAALGVACALVPSLAMWGFTVDDALIPVRYAHNLATGAGYRFDAAGAATDGVTPLPWAVLLAPLAGGDALETLWRAKVLGVVAWAAGGGVLGAWVGGRKDDGDGKDGTKRVHSALDAAALVVMAVAFPIGAWAGSGMETGIATAVATIAVVEMARGRAGRAAGLAGAVGVLRPEMVVWAVVIAVGAAVRSGGGSGNGGGSGGGGGSGSGSAGVPARLFFAALVAIAPFAVCALVRLMVFGRPAPLAVLAKPSDFSHGLTYGVAATVVLLTPFLAFAPLTLFRGSPLARLVLIAFALHLATVIAVGGDWMPYARLLVPVAPSLVIAFVDLARTSHPAASAARLVVAFVFGMFLIVRVAPAGRGVYRDRSELVARARPVLADAKVVAALDVGWVSASTNARLVDLAGLTDPSIAMLPGGHTSKRVDVAMLLDRQVDTVIIYSDPRVVEQRVLYSDLFESRFVATNRLPLGDNGASYTVFRRRPTP